MATATSNRNGNEGNDEGKHLLGVLKGKDKREVEGSQIVIGEQSKWSYNHFSNTPTPQSLAPPLLALNATRSLPSNDGLPSPASVSN